MPRPYSIPARYRRRPYKNTPADRQRIFSIVWDWFVTQGHPRCYNGNICMYRLTSDGSTNACAVGIFIPSCASPRIHQSIDNVAKLFGEFPTTMERIFDEGLIGFLAFLQNAHDRSDSAPEMVDNLREFAEEHNLTVPEPKP